MSPRLNHTPRPLPIALAHALVACKPGAPRLELLNRIFRGLDNAGRLTCFAEMRECQRAKRGELEAVVA